MDKESWQSNFEKKGVIYRRKAYLYGSDFRVKIAGAAAQKCSEKWVLSKC